MDSIEYSQWMAFERAHGTLGADYEKETMATVVEQLHTIAYLISQAKFTDKTHRRGPIEKPERYPRPNEESLRALRAASSVIDEDEAEWIPPTEDELVDMRIDSTETGEGE